ncbi:hypothetical protein IPH25_04645 [bacterium]|nr:MAG: hypothetical protein IPG37_01640 [bacterium]QQR61730.1 MAG: hypothetical protein IPH25_04645 [bacterium]QQR62702.1 MAG: hypothetical protein IPH67_04790 [bacterium]
MVKRSIFWVVVATICIIIDSYSIVDEQKDTAKAFNQPSNEQPETTSEKPTEQSKSTTNKWVSIPGGTVITIPEEPEESTLFNYLFFKKTLWNITVYPTVQAFNKLLFTFGLAKRKPTMGWWSYRY